MKCGESYKQKESACLNCGYIMTHAFCVGEEAALPNPGDYTLCINCAHLMCFADDLSLRDLTDKEIVAIAGDRRLLVATKAIHKCKGA